MAASLASVNFALAAEGGMSVQTGLLIADIVLLVLLALAVIGLLAMSARSRSLDAVLLASSAGRAALEALERKALPSGASTQEFEAASKRRSEVAKVRSDAAVRGVPGAGPWGPSWKDAYSISLQLAVAGGVLEARDLLRAAAPRSALPKWLLKKQRGLIVEKIWPKASRLTRGSECMEAAVAWARLAAECRSSDPVTASEAAANATRLFEEALWWLPAKDDVPVHVRIAQFRRGQGDLKGAIEELDHAVEKIRKQLPAVLPAASPMSAQSNSPQPARPEAALVDVLAGILELRLSVRLQQAGIPELGLAPASTSPTVAIDVQASQRIEADLAELGRIRNSVTDERLASVRRGALQVRWELARLAGGDQLRADAAAAEATDGRFQSTAGRIEGLPSFPGTPRLAPAIQSALDHELAWDREDQLLLAALRLRRLWRLRDEVAGGLDSAARFGGWRALEDFVEAVTFAWLQYDARRCLELPMVQWQLVQVSRALESKVEKSSSDDLQRLMGWLNYVRSRAQISPQVSAMRTPELELPLVIEPVASDRTAASLVCRVGATGGPLGRAGSRLEVMADVNFVRHSWANESGGGLQLHLLDESDQPLRRTGSFGFPTASLRVPVELGDVVQLDGGFVGSMARIATLDLSGLSGAPRVIRCVVRSAIGARELARADFAASALVPVAAAATARPVSLDGARDTILDLSVLWAQLLRLSGKTSFDLHAIQSIRDLVHAELGDEGVRKLGVALREASFPAVVDVEFVQSLVVYLERQAPSEPGLREMALLAWQRISRRSPDWRSALEQLIRRMPASVLSDEALHAIGLPRPGSTASPTQFPPAGFAPPVPTTPAPQPWAQGGGSLCERVIEETGVNEPLDTPASLRRALAAVSDKLMAGGVSPQGRDRLKCMHAELQALLGFA